MALFSDIIYNIEKRNRLGGIEVIMVYDIACDLMEGS